MNELLEFDGSLDEATRWLEKAQNDLSSLSDEDNLSSDWMPGLQEALLRFDVAFTALKAIREPVKEHIVSAEKWHEEQERWNPN